MSTSIHSAAGPSSAIDPSSPWPAPRNELSPTVARRVLAAALVGGLALQALFFGAEIGANWLICTSLCVSALIAGAPREKRTPVAWLAAAGAVLTSAGVVYRASAWALWVSVPATAIALVIAAFAVTDGTRWSDVGNMPSRWRGAFRPIGAVADAARVPLVATRSGPWRVVLGGVAVGTPVALAFGLLFSGDAGFMSVLDAAWRRLDIAARVVTWTLVSAAGLLFVSRLHEARNVPVAAATRDVAFRSTSNGPSPAMGMQTTTDPSPQRAFTPLAWGIVLAQVAAVFGVFSIAHARELFAGHAFVRSAAHVTYSGHLHRGFNALTVAVVASVVLVSYGHHRFARAEVEVAASAPTGRGTAAIAAVELALLALTGIAAASCWQRLRIYEEAYGATYLRVGVALVVLFAFGVLLLTAARSIARRWRGHASAVVGLAAALGLAASGFNADAYVARANLERAERGHPLDVRYLAGLGSDACEVAGHSYLREHPDIRAILRSGWSATSGGSGWRAWRFRARCVGPR